MRHIGDFRTLGSHTKRRVCTAHQQMLSVLERFVWKFPLIFYSPDDWSRRGKKVKEQETRGWRDVGKPAHNGGKGGKLLGGAT